MPPVARKSSRDTVSTNHACDGVTTTDQGSSDVYVNGIGVVRAKDLNKQHTVRSGKSCVPHTVALSRHSLTVFVNDRGVGRFGDSYGSETITSGSANVAAG